MQRLVHVIMKGNQSILHNHFKNTTIHYKQVKRNLNLLECDSKRLLQKYGVNVQNFITLNESDDIRTAIQNIDFKADQYVIKAQITAGGRGIGMFDNGYRGGIHIANKADDVENIIRNMMGHRLITKQTTATGVPVKKVMIAKGVRIRRESYFCILLDSSYNGPVIITSSNGGTDIEEIYKNNKSAIKIFPVDVTKGVTHELSQDIATCLGFNDKLYEKVSQEVKYIWKLFTNIDAIQIEVNPLVETDDDEIIAIDAKITFDDNALFRQKDIMKLHKDMNKEADKREAKASEYNLNYVQLDGNIGCLVNGAGLAMATMDIVKLYGGKPANFLDVGGGVNESQVSEAMKILMTDENIKSILINIFGGIVDCTIIANGIISAMKEVDISIPVTIRFEGNNVQKAREILSQFDRDFRISFADDLHEAAQLAVTSI